MFGRRFLACLATITAVLGGCQVIIGIHDETGARAVDAGREDPCTKAAPPPPPDAAPQDGGDEIEDEVTFAIRVFRLGGVNSPLVGYDLDGRCTGDTHSTTNSSPCRAAAGADTTVLTDGVGGIDNVFAKVMGSVSFGPGDPLSDAINKQVDGGAYTELFVLAGYNGQANDPDVKFGLLTGSRLLSNDCTVDAGLPEAGYVLPHWEGCDVWGYPEDSHDVFTTPSGRAGVYTRPGYVSDRVLVVSASSLTFALSGDRPLQLDSAMLTARIEGEGRQMRLVDGIVAGRADANGTLDTVGHLNYGSASDYVCDNGILMGLIKTRGCSQLDLPVASSDDGKDVACRAFSFAVGFEAERAIRGNPLRPSDSHVCDADLTCPP